MPARPPEKWRTGNPGSGHRSRDMGHVLFLGMATWWFKCRKAAVGAVEPHAPVGFTGSCAAALSRVGFGPLPKGVASAERVEAALASRWMDCQGRLCHAAATRGPREGQENGEPKGEHCGTPSLWGTQMI